MTTLNRRDFFKLSAAALALSSMPRTSSSTSAAALALRPRPAPSLSPSVSPNVVLIITDDMDARSLPAMRRLMAFPAGGWTNFTPHAVCVDGICAPSRATMLTGQYTRRHGVTANGRWNALDIDRALPVWLKNAGYTTALYGKYLWGGRVPARTPGWDIFTGKGGHSDGVFPDAADFIRHAGPAPFYLHVAPVDPHMPVWVPARYTGASVTLPPLPDSYNELDLSDKPDWLRRRPLLRDGKLKTIRRRQSQVHRSLMAVDDGVQLLIDTLAAAGRLDNTYIIFTSDHGMHRGEHRLDNIKHTPYEEIIRIPLLIRSPYQSANREDPHLVSNVDIAPTIADLARAAPLLPQDGRSLLPLLGDTVVNDPSAWRDAVLIEKYPDPRIPLGFAGLRTNRYTYVRWDTGERELYDLAADPYQMTSRHADPAYAGVLAALAAQLTTITAPPRVAELEARQ